MVSTKPCCLQGVYIRRPGGPSALDLLSSVIAEAPAVLASELSAAADAAQARKHVPTQHRPNPPPQAKPVAPEHPRQSPSHAAAGPPAPDADGAPPAVLSNGYASEDTQTGQTDSLPAVPGSKAAATEIGPQLPSSGSTSPLNAATTAAGIPVDEGTVEPRREEPADSQMHDAPARRSAAGPALPPPELLAAAAAAAEEVCVSGAPRTSNQGLCMQSLLRQVLAGPLLQQAWMHTGPSLRGQLNARTHAFLQAIGPRCDQAHADGCVRGARWLLRPGWRIC